MMTAKPPRSAPVSLLGTGLLRLLVSPLRHAGLQALRFALLYRVRRLICRVWDPVVEYDFPYGRLLLHLSHNLPLYRTTHPGYGEPLHRICSAVYRKYPRLTAIDVGANVGDTTSMIRRVGPIPVLCIEGAPEFAVLLRQNMEEHPGVKIAQTFLGARSGAIDAHVVAEAGTAFLQFGAGGAATLETLSQVLGRNERYARSKLVKVDTDGFDSLILRGAEPLIRDVRPVLFFEYDPVSLLRNDFRAPELFAWLSTCGYRSALIYEHTGRYLLTTDVSNAALLRDVTSFYLDGAAGRYCDVCVFHEADGDLASYLRESELALNCARA